VRGGVIAFLGRTVPVAVESGRERRRVRDSLAALRHERFRRFAAGVILSQTGGWIQAASFGYVVLLLGGSVPTLGVIGFLNTIPNLVCGLPAGALADRYDRRKLLFCLQGASMMLSALLAVLWATGSLTVVLMGAIAVVGGSLGAMSFPAFQGMIASTVPREHLESAVAINSLELQVARFVGPLIAGFLLATAGPTWVFAANAASFLAVLAAVSVLPGSGARATRAADNLGGAIKAGFRYMFASRSTSSLLALSVLTGLFAAPPVMFMIPAIVRFRLHSGPGTLGALTAAVGLGSLLGALVLVALSRRPNKGEPVIVAYLVTALALVGVGLSKSVALSLALAVIGLGRTLFLGLSTVVVQAASSNEMRARAMATWAVAAAGSIPVGALITAGLAAWLGVGGAVLVDGLLLLAGGVLLLALRPEARWLGCTTLPVACIAGTDPAAVAFQAQRTGTAELESPARA
jgi:predicted MFS family arabinose efflux permease